MKMFIRLIVSLISLLVVQDVYAVIPADPRIGNTDELVMTSRMTDADSQPISVCVFIQQNGKGSWFMGQAMKSFYNDVIGEVALSSFSGDFSEKSIQDDLSKCDINLTKIGTDNPFQKGRYRVLKTLKDGKSIVMYGESNLEGQFFWIVVDLP